tara:strand:- start:279 stop:494 length:216 start_codon:yes stop_codon:yes gene_type:complete
MMRKFDFKVGDLVKHRFINYGCGIIIEERESVEFGEILKAFVVYFTAEDLKRLVYITEIDEFVSDWGYSCR